jgi:hypothetical protein
MRDVLAVLGFLLAWVVVSRFVLPKMGIPT